MFPVIFSLGSITIYFYGFFIAMGYLASVALAVHLGKKEKLDPGKIVDLAFYLLVMSFIGARLLFVITRLDYFIANPMEIFYIWKGGLVFFGGFLSAFTFCIWYLRRHNMPILTITDIGAPAITLGHALGRIGCLAAGCCHGRYCELPWAIHIDSPHVQENLRGLPIHPTQIYSAVSLFLLAAFLVFVWHRRKFVGQVSLFYLILYPIIRSIIEIYRGDSIRGYVIPGYVTTSQFISFLIVIAALSTYAILKRKGYLQIKN